MFFTNREAPSHHSHRNGEMPFGDSTLTPTMVDEFASIILGIIGRGNAGKTALFRALSLSIMRDDLPSDLQFDVDDPLQTARAIEEARLTSQLIRERGLPPTLEPKDVEFYLFEGANRIARFGFREVVGQILTHTKPDSPPEQKAEYQEYVGHLSNADVKWVVVPCPPRDHSAEDVMRFRRDLQLTRSYLREALRVRRNPRPCSVALVMTKIDAGCGDENDARSHLTDDVLVDALKPLVKILVGSDQVSQAAIVPVSAFGFGKAMVRQTGTEEVDDEAARRNSYEYGEPEWILRPDAIQEPFNLTPLVVWSLMCGLLHQEFDAGESDPETVRAFRMLHSDLMALNGWFTPVKGQLFQP